MILGIYGLIGSGKSTVVEYLKIKYGFKIIDLDLVGRMVMQTDESISFIRNYIPEAYNIENKSIDQNKLRNILFSNWKKNKLVSKHIWPQIAEIANQALAKTDSDDLIIIEAAMLPAMGIEIDNLIYIATDNIQKNIKAVMSRDNRTLKETTSVLAIQTKYNKKYDYDVIIMNNDSIAALHKKIDIYLEKLNINQNKS